METMKKIINLQLVDRIDEDIADFNSVVVNYYSDFDKMLKFFEQTSLMQSFFESGHFGETNMERIVKIRKIMEQYIDTLSGEGGLISVTKKYVITQRELLTQKERGYSYNDSIGARREGNKYE